MGSPITKGPYSLVKNPMKGAPPDMYLIPNRNIMPWFEVDWIKTEGEIAPLQAPGMYIIGQTLIST